MEQNFNNHRLDPQHHDNRVAQPISWGQIANWNSCLYDFSVGTATALGDAGKFADVLQWCSLAAWFASQKGYNGQLSSSRLEAQLLRAAQILPRPVVRPRHASRPKWVHVLNQAYETLGHTNLCRRWIQYSAEVSHDVVLLDQVSEIPQNLAAVVTNADGRCIVFDPNTSQLQRAAQLRTYAWEEADVVVLHTHPEDVIATTAFGVAGGPPVLLVNHADHAFWVGCAVADLVLDLRTSGHLWTKRLRGVNRAAILPLPLLDEDCSSQQAPADSHPKLIARKTLGIPEDAIVLLTVGSAAKYQPIANLNFVVTAMEILKCNEKACVVAVGPKDEGEWRAARKATRGRIIALGRQPDTYIFCEAADIYLEGFPCGSLTALLEAALAGLPCVRSPQNCVPPFCSDGIPLDRVPQPLDVSDYVAIAKSLVADPQLRSQKGMELRKLTRDHHCQEGWLTHLRSIQELVPAAHSVYPDFKSVAVEDRMRDWVLSVLHVGSLPPNWNAIAVPFCVEAWKRTYPSYLLTDKIITELLSLTESSKSTSAATSRLVDRSSLQRTKKIIQRRGTYENLYARANQEFISRNVSAARKIVYRCVLTDPLCVVKLEWLKLLLKVHGCYHLWTGQGWAASTSPQLSSSTVDRGASSSKKLILKLMQKERDAQR